MPATLNNTGVLFNDSTQQNTAFLGSRATAYTSAGTFTFTIPTGVTALKITVVGGGGSSNYITGSGCCVVTNPGVAGGTSSVSSGTQSISTISATGGAGEGAGIGNFSGGIGSGGTLNARGGSGQVRFGGGSISVTGGASSLSFASFSAGVLGAAAGAAGGGGCAIRFLTGLTPGNTLSITVAAGGAVGTAIPGGAGVVLIEW